MSCVEELKKLKKLLDNNIITQEDFEEKKKQLLSDSVLSEDTTGIGQKNLKPKKKISKVLTSFQILLRKSSYKKPLKNSSGALRTACILGSSI